MDDFPRDGKTADEPPARHLTEEEADRADLEAVRKRRGQQEMIAQVEKETEGAEGEEDRIIRPLLRLKWTRMRRDPRTGALSDGKVVYIYGERNIEDFFAWRRARKAARKSTVRKKEGIAPAGSSTASGTVGTATVLGTASRTCRRCGQVGHISSNPICPQYSGPRRSRPLRLPSPGGAKRRRQSTVPIPYDLDAFVGSELDIIAAAGKPPKTASDDPVPVRVSGRMSARQRTLWEKKGALETNGGSIDTFRGSLDQAQEEINQLFHRIIIGTKKERSWALFWERVEEGDAPSYYLVIKQPMWLSTVVEKCKQREYESAEAFMSDIRLIQSNCYLFNPVGHWLRPLADGLLASIEDEMQKLPFLKQLEEFIQNKLSISPSMSEISTPASQKHRPLEVVRRSRPTP
eukprot:GHVO01053418.1.p2 GENE.GHVO01053418.1~~GHVO01053418.1.p2  ORF type:complete len:429 (+),score=91.51 GHVO01053418.1:73-1287(+)